MRKVIFMLMMSFIHLNLFSQKTIDISKIEKVLPFSNEEVTLKSSWIKQREELNITFLK